MITKGDHSQEKDFSFYNFIISAKQISLLIQISMPAFYKNKRRSGDCWR